MLELRGSPEPLPRVVGWVGSGLFAVLTAGGVAYRVGDRPLLAVLAGAAAVAGGTVAFLAPRLRVPGVVTATAAVAVLCNGDASNIGWFGLCVLTALCALGTPLVVAGGCWLGTTLLLGAELVFSQADHGWTAWLGGTTFTFVASLIGRRERELVRELQQAQAGLAARAQAEERTRIARELHDVIAHSLTVSLLHITGARLAVEEEPAEAAQALAEAERLVRASLDEVRQVVGTLRPDGSGDGVAPLPGAADVPRLVDGFRDAGADVSARITGDLDAVPGTVGLAAYRILQEALTNATRHAPGAPATVEVRVDAHTVRLEVDSRGRPGSGSGHGLAGMRERARALGGSCDAGPSGQGWLVHAELPLGPEGGFA